MRRFLALTAFVPIAAGLATAAPAPAGTFDVSACDDAPGFVNNSWRAEVSPGLLTYNACPSSDNPRFGLGARATLSPSRRTVPAGAAARWRIDAPPDTAIVGIRADALFEQYNSRWQVGLLNGSRLLVGCRATRSPTGGACIGSMSARDYVALPPSSVIYTEVYCLFGPCPMAVGGSPTARASVTFARVTIADNASPMLASVGGDMWTSGWLRGTRHVSFDAADNTGIEEVRALIDGGLRSSARRECDPTLATCSGWPGVNLSVPTRTDVADGEHTLSLQAVDRADNVGDLTRKVLIDNTPPASPQTVAVSGGDSWKSKAAFDVAWKNPPQDFAPIAGVEYTLCPAPPAAVPCVSGSKDGAGVESLAGLEVPQPGDWLLTTWLRDEAGNAAPETAAPPVHLRVDPTPPQVVIRQTDPEDPSRVHVDTSDDLSGVTRAEIELRRQGTEIWRQLEATVDPAGGYSAPLHDERLRDGVYELRARAWDAAGNERSSSQFATGAPAALTLPLRVKTQLKVGKALKLHARRGRGARRHTRTLYITRPLIRHGRRVRLHGRLVAPGGNPVQGAAIDVAARSDLPGTAFQPVGTLTTSRTGRFNYLVPAGTSRVLRFDYPGAPKIRPQTREVEIRVRASSTIRSNRRSVVNGEAVTFSGRLRSSAIPPGGKLVELQYFDRGKWRTFRTTRATAPEGRWRYAYRFDGTRGIRRYRFRIAIPRESGYPFATGRSATVPVTVRGL